MLELISNSSGEGKSQNEKAAKFRTSQININALIPSKENFYSTDEKELKDLKDSIEIFGIQQNLVVKKVNEKNVSDLDTKYEIIAGHRRYLALKKLVEEGKQQFEYAPCKIENEEDLIKDNLLLLITNSTARQLTDWERTQQAEKLKALLTEYKKKEKLPGRVREIIADILNTSPSQVARMESINNNLTEEAKQQLKEGNLTMTAAYETSKLPEDKQKEIAAMAASGGEVRAIDLTSKIQKKVSESDTKLENNKNDNFVVIDDDIVDKSTGEIVQQVVPNYLERKTVVERIRNMTNDELADFICNKCAGIGGGGGCSGICDLALLCKGKNKHEICVKWLNTHI